MGWGGWGMMFGWLLILVVVLLAVWAMTRAGPPGGTGEGTRGDADPAEAILREQYARGDIDEETYRRRLSELRRD